MTTAGGTAPAAGAPSAPPGRPLPADGFKPAGPLPPAQLPGVLLAALASLGIGAMCTVMLPLTATMLGTLLLGTDGTNVIPVVIVAVVVAHVVAARLTPLPAKRVAPSARPAAVLPAPAPSALTSSPG
jgi:hypothetical protein